MTNLQIDEKISTMPNFYDCAICTCEHDNDPDLCNCSGNLSYDFDNCKNEDFDANCNCDYCKSYPYLYATEIQQIPDIYLTSRYINALTVYRLK